MTESAATFATEQETFWSGKFGDDYIARNEHTPVTLAGNLFFFAKALSAVRSPPQSIIELGANIGLNLRALRLLYPGARRTAVEINAQAVARLHRDHVADEVVHGSILDFQPAVPGELALIKGVMIHLNPEMLPGVYRTLAACSSRWVLIAEYYNRRPDEVLYRGHAAKLFRRDFGGEFMDACPDFELVDSGFSYHRDARECQDDLTWFLFQRRA